MFKKKKTFSDRLKSLFGLGIEKDEFYDDLEDLLFEADLGSRVSFDIIERVKEEAKAKHLKDSAELEALVAECLGSEIKTTTLEIPSDSFSCFLFLGVNGAGKTTSIAKLANRYMKTSLGQNIVLAAGDTFRAAACEQLLSHGKRLGLRTINQGAGADPAAVIFDAVESAKARGERLVLADTAGRLQNKSHLVKELEKIDKVVRQKLEPKDVYKKILVIDATTGQNGLQQAEIFNQAIGVDAVILSKYDSTARGGIVVSICRETGIPVAFVGTGEHYDALEPFSVQEFTSRILNREL